MLDTLSTKLLEKLNEICYDGNYKVLSKEEVISFLSMYNVDENSLDNIVKHLETREFINVKYNNDGVYCLALMPKGRLLDEKSKQDKLEKKKNKKIFTYLILASTFASFAGASLSIILFKFVFWGFKC